MTEWNWGNSEFYYTSNLPYQCLKSDRWFNCQKTIHEIFFEISKWIISQEKSCNMFLMFNKVIIQQKTGKHKSKKVSGV